MNQYTFNVKYLEQNAIKTQFRAVRERKSRNIATEIVEMVSQGAFISSIRFVVCKTNYRFDVWWLSTQIRRDDWKSLLCRSGVHIKIELRILDFAKNSFNETETVFGWQKKFVCADDYPQLNVTNMCTYFCCLTRGVYQIRDNCLLFANILYTYYVPTAII